MTTFPEIFERLQDPKADHPAAVRAAFDAILRGEWTPVQVAGLAVTLRLLGEQADVIAAAAESLRASMIAVDHGLGPVLDTCGTGGDGLSTWNISTAAAFVACGAGVHVAKHGNRAVSSRSGSADVLEALGVPLDVAPEKQAAVLREARVCFLFAPAHHPAMRHGGVARRELGIRTLFNALGPLANPAGATLQLLGAYDDALRPVLARTLAKLGTTRAWVVRGEDGLDEVSPCAPTRVSVLEDGEVTERVITPEDFGLSRLSPSCLRGGDARDSAAMIRSVLAGEGHPARDMVILNAAAALVVATGLAPKAAREAAEASVADGAAAAALEALIAAATRAKAA